MSEVYWENGERVQAVEPQYESEVEHRIDSPVLIMMRRLIGFLQKSPHPAFSIDCLSLITGIGYCGKSMAQIARDHNMTRASASKRCVDLCEYMGLSPVRAMRNESGQINCRKAQIERQKEIVEKHIRDWEASLKKDEWDTSDIIRQVDK